MIAARYEYREHFVPDDLWEAEQQLYRSIELQAALKRRSGLSRWRYRGEHRPRPGASFVDELRREWDGSELTRRCEHLRSLRRPFNPGPVYLGTERCTVRVWLPGESEQATLKLLAAESPLTIPAIVPALAGPNPGAFDREHLSAAALDLEPAEWPSTAEVEAARERALEQKQALERKLAELGAAGEVLKDERYW